MPFYCPTIQSESPAPLASQSLLSQRQSKSTDLLASQTLLSHLPVTLLSYYSVRVSCPTRQSESTVPLASVLSHWPIRLYCPTGLSYATVPLASLPSHWPVGLYCPDGQSDPTLLLSHWPVRPYTPTVPLASQTLHSYCSTGQSDWPCWPHVGLWPRACTPGFLHPHLSRQASH